MNVLINIPLSIDGDDNNITVLGERCRVAKAMLRQVPGTLENYRLHMVHGDHKFLMVGLLDIEHGLSIIDVDNALTDICVALRQSSCRRMCHEAREVHADGTLSHIEPEDMIPWGPKS